MPKVEVYQVDDKHWSFLVDGAESMAIVADHPFPDEIQMGPGVYLDKETLRLPSSRFPEGTYGVWRMIRRIRQAAVREVQRYHRGKVVKLPRESEEAPREWTFEFDDVQSTEKFDSEPKAIAALGWHAFMNRGAIGRLDEIASLFKMQTGSKDATCEVQGGKFVVTCRQTGATYLARPDIRRTEPPDDQPFKPPLDVEFKQIGGATPEQPESPPAPPAEE